MVRVRVCVAAALSLTSLVIVEPAAAHVQRVSVSTAGGQADGASDAIATPTATAPSTSPGQWPRPG